MKRKATALWHGSGKEGHGHLTTQSTVLEDTQYSYKSRFEDGIGTNPEELVAAAHAGCFCMKLSFVVGNHGFTPLSLDAECTITLGDGEITQSHIVLKAEIEGISEELFAECVKDAEENCPISRLFNTEIVVEYTLN